MDISWCRSIRRRLWSCTYEKDYKQNMPLQIGCSVFDDSKLRMLQFYYDCLDKYISREDFKYLETDTDSAYMALSSNFEDLINRNYENLSKR